MSCSAAAAKCETTAPGSKRRATSWTRTRYRAMGLRLVQALVTTNVPAVTRVHSPEAMRRLRRRSSTTSRWSERRTTAISGGVRVSSGPVVDTSPASGSASAGISAALRLVDNSAGTRPGEEPVARAFAVGRGCRSTLPESAFAVDLHERMGPRCPNRHSLSPKSGAIADFGRASRCRARGVAAGGRSHADCIGSDAAARRIPDRPADRRLACRRLFGTMDDPPSCRRSPHRPASRLNGGDA